MKKNKLGLPEEFKVQVYQKKISKHHNDPFWYDGDIALIKYKDREVMIIAGGEIRIINKEGEICHDGSKERGPGFPEFKHGLDSDFQLAQLDDLGYTWSMNNWFEFLWKFKGDSSWNDIMGDVEYGYDETVRHAKDMLEDDAWWAFTDRPEKSKQKE